MSRKAKLRTFASFMYQHQLETAAQGGGPARMLAATGRRRDRHQKVDIRYVVTSLEGTAQFYEDVYANVLPSHHLAFLACPFAH